MSHWSFAASTWVVLLGAAIWLGAGWLCFANWQRSGRRKTLAWLEALRFILITLTALTLLRPELVQQLKRSEQPQIAVLMDASASMNTRDIAVGTNGVTSRSDWLEQKKSVKFWKPLEKSGKVLLEQFGGGSFETNAATKPDPGTDINATLELALQQQRNLKAVLLVTDGDWNAGKTPVSAAMRLREENIPVFAVSVGRDCAVPDLVVENVTAPSYGLLGEEIAIPFRISSHLPHEVKTTISLIDPNWEETRKEITIPANGELQEAILWSPRVVGESTLTLKLPVEPDEAIAENNQQSFHINIRVDKLKVLVVDSLPRWEYRYLRNALARDPGVEMNCILFHPGMDAGGGRNYLSSFPGTKEAISKYDVVFLGDVGIGDNELTERDAELIKGVVEQQSSGLIFLPGSRGREYTFLNSPLKDLFPVVLDEKKSEGLGLQNESSLLLTTLGRRHLLTRFDSDENRNDELWKQLPGFYWCAAVEKNRPGSEVLAVHSSLRNSFGRLPLLVTRAAGTGKVLFMGTDSAWRWRRGVEDKFHYRFWSQVVRWMAHQRHLSEKEGVRLSYSPETPHVGDTVFLQGTLLDASGLPVENDIVHGKIISPANRSERLDFSPVEGGWGVFKSTFSPVEGGKYKVQLASDKSGRNLETEILVTQPIREKVGQPINGQILQEVANITHGAAASYDKLDDIVQKISLLPEPKPIEKRIRLWSDPWWGGLILFLLTIYWVGRKFAGMV